MTKTAADEVTPGHPDHTKGNRHENHVYQSTDDHEGSHRQAGREAVVAERRAHLDAEGDREDGQRAEQREARDDLGGAAAR